MILTHTISLTEVLWTAVALIGLAFNVRILIRAIGDLLLVKYKRINSIREYAAATTMILFAALAMVQAMFVIDGALAMTIPAPNNKVSALNYIITGSFMLVSFIMAGTAYMQDKRREYILKMIQEVESETKSVYGVAS